MFRRTFRITLQNLFRSPLFWLTVLLVTGISIYLASGRSYTYYDEALNDVIPDTDPRFVLDFKTYVQHVTNTCAAKSMIYALPLFAVVTSSLTLMRDYGDKFFEIERAAGIKPARYVWGRVAALLIVNTVMTFVQCFLCFYWYVFTRGGVDGMDTITMLGDSVIRLSRATLLLSLPAVLFYAALTYGVGCLCKNWIPAAALTVAYSQLPLLMNYTVSARMLRIYEAYENYIMPIPKHMRHFLHYYDTDWHEKMLENFGIQPWDPWIALSVILGSTLLYLLLSHICVRRRRL